MVKIKGILGFCQAKGCWNRSTLTVEAKNINVKRHMCDSCCERLLRKGGDLNE